jgi:predicted ribosome quality control (RQC) complex YloA/Tae2 family protein
VERTIARVQERNAAKIASLQSGLDAAGRANDVMQQGQLVLAYGHALTPGSDRLDIPDLDVSIPLDSTLSPADNAERLFRRYRKLKDASRRVPELLRAAETEKQRLADLLTYARIADSESALREVERQISLSPRPENAPTARATPRRAPLRLRREGFTALVGRNAQENDVVTFNLAGRGDLWFHARDRTGAHVVLQGPYEPPDDVIVAAAAVAGYFSEARTDAGVDVVVAHVRDVRRVPGGPPGRVTYRKERTVRASPSLEGWQRL